MYGLPFASNERPVERIPVIGYHADDIESDAGPRVCMRER
jgi:hypothetical protein